MSALFRSRNPADGEIVATYPTTTGEAVDASIAAVGRAQRAWSSHSIDQRATVLRDLADRLRDSADRLADLMAVEMGKPLAEGRAEATKCAWACDFYAEQGADFLADEAIATDAASSRVAYRPLGVVLAIMPWNFPLWQVVRFAAPALMAGNGVVLKHAPNVPGCALAIEALVRGALGDDDGLFANLFIDESTVGEVIADPRVHAVTLTGSTRAGRAVAARAGQHLKKTVLELGGSDPYLVLDDADLDLAADAAVAARLLNSGQSCIAAKRFVVVESVREAFTDRVVERMAAARMGDPRVAATTLGPLARHDLRDALHEQVERSVAAGARRLLGGQIPDGPGAFYPATVLDAVGPGMPAYDEEVFGPVAAIVPVADEGDAIRVANDSSYGLGAAVFTRDVERGERIATEHLDAGCCFVNTFVRSDPRLPFGGVKDSGYGRELARHGLLEFVNVKTVWVD